MRRCRRALLGLILAVPAFGQATPPAAAPPILQGATLPMYPPIAKAAHITGKAVIWNSSWGALDDKVLTNFITHDYHYSNGKPYEETTPHDGGKP
jgi:hypothetical protein